MGFPEIISTIGVSGIIIGAIAWLMKSVITQLLSKDIELFKANLQRDSQQEIMRLQSSLQLVQFEHQVRFSKLHERQAEIIAEIYSKLIDLHKNISNFIKSYLSIDDNEKNEQINIIWAAVDKFFDYYDRHRIYLKNNTCSEIDELTSTLSKACSGLVTYGKYARFIKAEADKIYDELNKAKVIMDDDVVKIKQSLEDSFRDILGVLEIDKDTKI